MAKGVLIVLIFFSVFSWAISYKKYTLFKKLRGDSEAFLRIFRKSSRFSEISGGCETLRNTPLVEVFLAGYEELQGQLASQSSNEPPSTATKLKTINVIQDLQKVLGEIYKHLK